MWDGGQTPVGRGTDPCPMRLQTEGFAIGWTDVDGFFEHSVGFIKLTLGAVIARLLEALLGTLYEFCVDIDNDIVFLYYHMWLITFVIVVIFDLLLEFLEVIGLEDAVIWGMYDSHLKNS